MPAPLDVDWEAVKTLALAVGVREAARQYGISEDSAMQRSAREGWLKQRDQLTTQVSQIIAERRTKAGLSATVSKPSEIMRNVLREGRNGWQLATAKVGKRLGGMDEDELMTPGVSEAAAKWSGVAAKAGLLTGEREQSYRLEVIARAGSEPIDIEAEVVESGVEHETGIDSGHEQA